VRVGEPAGRDATPQEQSNLDQTRGEMSSASPRSAEPVSDHSLGNTCEIAWPCRTRPDTTYGVSGCLAEGSPPLEERTQTVGSVMPVPRESV
jgi:hypothetical protein